jgi:hypothetical protein
MRIRFGSVAFLSTWLVALLLSACSTTSTPTPNPTPTVSAALSNSPSSSPSAPSAAPTSAANAWGPFPVMGLQHRPDPNPLVTPGLANPAVTQATIGQTICVSGYSASIRPPSSYTGPLKVQQISAYGYTDTATTSYEEDHLIALEDGGDPRDPRNLWPEPRVATLPDGLTVGFHVKDVFENWIHTQVCSGAITLDAGRHMLSDDWVGAWLANGRP